MSLLSYITVLSKVRFADVRIEDEMGAGSRRHKISILYTMWIVLINSDSSLPNHLQPSRVLVWAKPILSGVSSDVITLHTTLLSLRQSTRTFVITRDAAENGRFYADAGRFLRFQRITLMSRSFRATGSGLHSQANNSRAERNRRLLRVLIFALFYYLICIWRDDVKSPVAGLISTKWVSSRNEGGLRIKE